MSTAMTMVTATMMTARLVDLAVMCDWMDEWLSREWVARTTQILEIVTEWYIQSNAAKTMFAASWANNGGALNALREVKPIAAAYLEAAEPWTWAEALFHGRRFGHGTSNIAESVNSTLLVERELPVLELLDSIWHRVMEKRSGRRSRALKLIEERRRFGQRLMRHRCLLWMSRSWRSFPWQPATLLPREYRVAGRRRCAFGERTGDALVDESGIMEGCSLLVLLWREYQIWYPLVVAPVGSQGTT
ncbi:hypothetical protein VC83_08726 [Pseudogymnoascus destructans]|uniref:Uncharacterized protein n=1 Tax=Pseudogymnoascus destructans TaxID=655981 RepID=A0A176ZYU2_9PEZI|nr:uncharacterized protein VC83_08726 [Pseudogymnoascus destructans]OAF55086.1 hypothetical protein VC83_08726 [Pseudogymnoascus destructans]